MCQHVLTTVATTDSNIIKVLLAKVVILDLLFWFQMFALQVVKALQKITENAMGQR